MNQEAIEQKAVEKATAVTILKQLGGNKFICCTGAKNFLFGKSEKSGNVFLSFQFPRRNINRCRVELMADDTYKMTFGYYNGKDYSYKVEREICGLYFDQLQEIFTEVTGLDTHL